LIQHLRCNTILVRMANLIYEFLGIISGQAETTKITRLNCHLSSPFRFDAIDRNFSSAKYPPELLHHL